MKLSIVIVNYYAENYLMKCLASLQRYAPEFPYEVIVVDNGSEENLDLLLSDFPEIQIIKKRENIGYSRANNEAIRRSSGEYILLLNPDTILTESALERLVDFMERNGDAGLASPRLLNRDGTLQYSCRSFPTYLNVFFGRRSLMRRLFPNNRMTRDFMLTDLDYTKVQEVDWVRTASAIVRRRALEGEAPFDESFFLYVEDTDLCFRLKKKGWKIYHVPDAVVYHYLGSSTQKRRAFSLYHHNTSMYRFFVKHYHPSRIGRFFLSLFLGFRLITLLGFEIVR